MPLWRVFASPVTTPLSNSSTTPSENISVWIPRSRFSLRKSRTASGISPMPICRVEPFSMRSATFLPIARATVAHLAHLRQLDHRPVDLDHVGEARDVDEASRPSERGIRRLTRATTVCARLGGRLRALDPDAVGAEAVLVGRRDVDEGDVHRDGPRADEAGDLGEEHRHQVGTALVDRLAHVRAREERPVAERARVASGPRGRRRRR